MTSYVLPLPIAQANAKQIYDFFLGAGLTAAQASGMVAQAEAEASLDPLAMGDHDEAFGLFQLHADRITAIEQGCGIDLRKLPDVEMQCKAIWWELSRGAEKKALDEIRTAATAYDAGALACIYYERPGAPGQADKRGRLAETWFAYFNPAEAAP